MIKYTPGPWILDDGSQNVLPGFRVLVATGRPGPTPSATGYSEIAYPWPHGLDRENRKMQEVNARLIAAAPDMLEALKGARAAFIVEYDIEGGAQSVSYNGDALRPLIRLLDAAIAKAEGQS